MLALLYAWECLVTLPSNAVVFRGGRRRARARQGGGLRWLHPWPSAACWVTGWFPLSVDGEVICSAVGAGRAGLKMTPGERRCRSLSEASRLETKGAVLEIDGEPWVPTPTEAHALLLLRLCQRLAAAESSAPLRRWRAALRWSWNDHALRRELRGVKRATLSLAVLCDAYVTVVFVAAPLAILLIGEEPALLALAPLAALLHVASVLALWAAARLNPGVGEAVGWEGLLVAALYPPALWRAPQGLRSEALARFQPLTFAAVLMSSDGFARFAGRRAAILDSTRAGCDPEEGATDVALERRALARLAAGRGLDAGALETAPPRDPDGVAYCPACGSAYVSPVDECRDCGVPTRAWDTAPVVARG